MITVARNNTRKFFFIDPHKIDKAGSAVASFGMAGMFRSNRKAGPRALTRRQHRAGKVQLLGFVQGPGTPHDLSPDAPPPGLFFLARLTPVKLALRDISHPRDAS